MCVMAAPKNPRFGLRTLSPLRLVRVAPPSMLTCHETFEKAVGQ